MSVVHRPAPVKLTERHVQSLVRTRQCVQRSHKIAVPNVMRGFGESDLVTVTRADYLHEFEIKLSRSDFRADFRNKHHKHRLYSGELEAQAYQQRWIPNHFWFVAPKGMLQADEIPEYAGLIEIDDRLVVSDRIDAPRLHKRKVDDSELMRLYETCMHRFWKWAHEATSEQESSDG